MAFGTLFVVSTPIGNLEDLSYRAVSILKNTACILSEDTRQTQKLLNKYSIMTRQISYRDQNHDNVLPAIMEVLKGGNDVALVSDSGTPVLSDPGFKLIRELRSLNYSVVSVPGPSSITAALSVSGLPTDNFTFIGFLQKKENDIKRQLMPYIDLDTTIIFFESPYRIRKSLRLISRLFSDREVFVAKDMTKMFEASYNFRLSCADEIIDTIPEKGEYVVLLAKSSYKLYG